MSLKVCLGVKHTFTNGKGSLESRGQIRYDYGMLYIIGKIFLKAIICCRHIFKINLI
jgi:hypothetical protein